MIGVISVEDANLSGRLDCRVKLGPLSRLWGSEQLTGEDGPAEMRGPNNVNVWPLTGHVATEQLSKMCNGGGVV